MQLCLAWRWVAESDVRLMLWNINNPEGLKRSALHRSASHTQIASSAGLLVLQEDGVYSTMVQKAGTRILCICMYIPPLTGFWPGCGVRGRCFFEVKIGNNECDASITKYCSLRLIIKCRRGVDHDQTLRGRDRIDVQLNNYTRDAGDDPRSADPPSVPTSGTWR